MTRKVWCCPVAIADPSWEWCYKTERTSGRLPTVQCTLHNPVEARNFVFRMCLITRPAFLHIFNYIHVNIYVSWRMGFNALWRGFITRRRRRRGRRVLPAVVRIGGERPSQPGFRECCKIHSRAF